MEVERSQPSCELSALLEVCRLVGEESVALEDVPSRMHSWSQSASPYIDEEEAPRPPKARNAHSNRSHGSAREYQGAGAESQGTAGGCRMIQGGPCASCGATEAPQWRRPDPGTLLLCNRCGIHFMRYKKLPGPRKEISAAKATPPDSPGQVKRKAIDSYPDSDAELQHGPTTSTASGSCSLSASPSEVVYLHKMCVRRPPTAPNMGSLASRLSGPSSTDALVKDQNANHQVSQGLLPRRTDYEETSMQYDAVLPQPFITQIPRRPSQGPRTQRRHSASAASSSSVSLPPQPYAPLDMRQLQHFLELTQSMQQGGPLSWGPAIQPDMQHSVPVSIPHPDAFYASHTPDYPHASTPETSSVTSVDSHHDVVVLPKRVSRGPSSYRSALGHSAPSPSLLSRQTDMYHLPAGVQVGVNGSEVVQPSNHNFNLNSMCH